MTKRTLLSILMGVIILVIAGTMIAHAEEICRSPHGGYCVNFAAIARAQTTALDFLGSPDTPDSLFTRLYTLGISIVALAAFITLVAAGVMYITAGDNEGRATQAKSWIQNAVYGLALALLAYLILFTINPDLVRTPFPTITPIKKVPQDGGFLGGGFQEGSFIIFGSGSEFSSACQAGGGNVVPVSGQLACFKPGAEEKQRITGGSPEVERCKNVGGKGVVISGKLYCDKPFK
jgi:hypothetical protein